MRGKPKWLERHVLLTPCLTLCLSEREFRRVVDAVNFKRGEREKVGSWISARADATTHFFNNGKTDITIVCFDPTRKTFSTAALAAIMAHEARHVWEEVLTGYPKVQTEELDAIGIQLITLRLVAEYERRTACRSTSRSRTKVSSRQRRNARA